MEKRFSKEIVRYRHNVLNICSLDAFSSVRGGVNKNVRDVYFARALMEGYGHTDDIDRLDASLRKAMGEGRLSYKRVDKLPPLTESEKIDRYRICYRRWTTDHRGGLITRVTADEPGLALALGEAWSRVLGLYRMDRPGLSASMEMNLAVKMLHWFDTVMGDGLLSHWGAGLVVKIVADGVEKEQEYLFFYMLTLVGADVLLIQRKSDLTLKDTLKDLSTAFVPKRTARAEPEQASPQPVETAARPVVKRSDRTPASRKEKDLEGLALCAGSVVMIEVHNDKGELVGAGSGIMIGRDGYILTNDHVARGGCLYSVRIEDDERIYRTDEVIKYDPVRDLAVIRIQRTLTPLPVYRGGTPLVRGQRVVAIGSPLGLFNSVSDGIISGFRRIGDVDMIQFTAPISHGSSGGAVLDMCGEVIGMSTAGMDGGQNLNLAVGYEWIGPFIRGFV